MGALQIDSASRPPSNGATIEFDRDGGHISQPPAQFRLQTVTTHEEFLHLEKDWSSLEARSPEATIFQRFGWCKAWIEAARSVGLPETLRIVTIRCDSRLVFVWPLAVRTLFGARLAHWLGEPATQYGDVLIEQSAHRSSWLEAAWREVRSWRDIDGVELRRVRADAAATALPEVASDLNVIVSSAAPFVDLGNSPASVNQSFGRRSRSHNSLRRHLRRLEALGPPDFQLIEAAENQCKAVSETLALKQRWLAAKGRMSAGHHHPANGGFLHVLAAKGELVVSRLSVGGESAAFEIGMIMRGKRYYSMLQSYDLRFAAYGPGQLLLLCVLRRCSEMGVSVFDFLAPAQTHKRQWASGEILVNDYFVALSSRGRAVKFGLHRVKPALRWTFENLPSSARRALGQVVSLHGLSQ
jgi:CelD/BcsL family acetyltransferase involved in cellulose biosynthesis